MQIRDVEAINNFNAYLEYRNKTKKRYHTLSIDFNLDDLNTFTVKILDSDGKTIMQEDGGDIWLMINCLHEDYKSSYY